MDWNTLVETTNLKDVVVTLIKPIRHGEYYLEGRLTGFKSGILNRDGNCIKKPKVHISYDIYTYGKGPHCDWVAVDNCTFEIKE